MSDDFQTMNQNTGRKYQALGLLAVGALCFLAGRSSVSTQNGQTFLTADVEAYEATELRRFGGGGNWRDIDIDRVNRKVDFVWAQLLERTDFDGEVSYDETLTKTKRVFQLVGKGNQFNQVVFDAAWNNSDTDGSGELNVDEFKACVDFVVNKVNEYAGNAAEMEASV